MSHNIYVSNFYFTVDKETKSFGFPKMNLDVPQPHICSLKTTEYEVLPDVKDYAADEVKLQQLINVLNCFY